MTSQVKRIRVSIIGSGPAGLVAARHLLNRPEQFETIIFEQSGSIGGAWVYTDAVGTDENGLAVHSSMYKGLRTNLPKEIMKFPDFEYPENLPSFISHEIVKEYLQNYAKHFNILEKIWVYKKVTKVCPQFRENKPTLWNITLFDTKSMEEQNITCDAVIVCNGHFSVPEIPDIPNISKFSGQTLHSHDYRDHKPFIGKSVVILGAGYSGLDIGLEVARVAKQVLISHNNSRPIQSKLLNNMTEKPILKEALENGFVFEDGSSCQADFLILCTGYKYNFSFLCEKCNLTINERRVTPLYQHLIHIEHPTLCLVGLLQMVVPFPVFDCQVKFFIASLDGSMTLPSKEEMIQHSNNDYLKRLQEGLSHRCAHVMSERLWSYLQELAEVANFDPLPGYIRLIYEHVSNNRRHMLLTYKEYNYEITGPTSFDVY